MTRFPERKLTLYKKCWLMEKDFNARVDMKVIYGTKVYRYKSNGFDDSSLASPTEVCGPGDMMTHNEAIRARADTSTLRVGESIAGVDAGRQRQRSIHGNWRPANTGDYYDEPTNVQPQSNPDLTPERNSKDHDTPLYQPLQMSRTPSITYTQNMAAPGSRSQTPDTQGSPGQRRGNGATTSLSRPLEKSPSPPKRTYNALSDLTSSSSPSALGSGSQTIRDEVLPKKRRLVKQESVRNLLSSIPQFVPLPPSLISPLRSTR